MSDDDTYEVPLQDQRIFGAGIKRQRVKFVPSSSSSTTSVAGSTLGNSVSDLYLSLVLPQEVLSSEVGLQSSLASPKSAAFAHDDSSTLVTADPLMCEVCQLPLASSDDAISPTSNGASLDSSNHHSQPTRPKGRPHEASLAHQVCITHSHQPSHLDRNRKGLAYLTAYGWDPDSRKGLGAEGQGIKFPIKTRPKDDKLGIGVVLPKPGDIKRKEKLQKLDAGKIRKLHAREKRKEEKLRDLFYRSEDVERHLSGG